MRRGSPDDALEAGLRRVGLDRPFSVRRAVTRFALAGFFALITVALITAFEARDVGLDLAFEDAQRVTAATAKAFVEPALDDAILQLDRTAIEKLQMSVVDNVLTDSLVRVKLWDRTGRIIYSDEARLIGQSFDVEPDEIEIIDGTAGPAVHATDLGAPENVYETKGKMVEVYRRVVTPNGTPLLFEAYFDYEAVNDVSSGLWRNFAPIALGSLVVLQLVQIPLAWRLSRKLRAGQTHRERLLAHAAEASAAERQRIASDLHDGVVQDLTGVSMTLTAMTSSGSDDPRLAQAADSLRNAVKSMRSLLVDIYPPNLQTEGLESALNDLVSGIRSRGVETQLLVDIEGTALGRLTSMLLYRCAQEAVRNIVSHSMAEHARITLTSSEADVMLTVDDDGRGFSTETFKDSQSDGHVGLKALAGLVEDAGGRLVALSSEGAGTRVQVTLPAYGHNARRSRRDSRRNR